jgi:hypothetical protein
MQRILIYAAVIAASFAVGREVQSQTWDFEEAELGKPPAGWTAAKTGDGEGSVWKVTEDKSAPSGARVIAQTAKGPRPLFNLCVAEDSKAVDLELSAAFKAVAGDVDQGGGLVWRYVDASNYYIARFNPLEDNFRLYKVMDGKRIQLATKEGLKAPAGEWHTLAIRMKGDEIACSLNGKRELEAKDGTFAKAGRIGLWTKADAQTYFDKVEVAVIK